MHLIPSPWSMRLSLDLSGNFLRCGCQDINFLTWLLHPKVTLSDRENLLCSHPKQGTVSVHNQVVHDLEQFCFPSHANVIASSGVSTLAIVGLMVVSVLVYRKRWTIRFHLHAARESWVKFLRRKDRSRGHTYQFDAFVVYNRGRPKLGSRNSHDNFGKCQRNEALYPLPRLYSLSRYRRHHRGQHQQE